MKIEDVAIGCICSLLVVFVCIMIELYIKEVSRNEPAVPVQQCETCKEKQK